jgi:(E)-4-hydroxy-3-methylbut-2-enyl-diphosphate synthase
MQEFQRHIQRRKSRQVAVGTVRIGGDAPISVQSMANTPTTDVPATLALVKRLANAGCDLVRISVPDRDSVTAFAEIHRESPVPLIADIHFDYRLAVAVAPHADKLRINPGNIGGKDRIREIILACKDNGIPIRVGVNGGSLPKDLYAEYGLTPEALVKAALRHIELFDELGFHDLVLSIKSSNVPMMVEACRQLAAAVDYPQHLGVTEAGPGIHGATRSAVGVGLLLAEGIGDTIRISLTGDKLQEVKVAYEILDTLGIRRRGIRWISCPTCARTKVDVEKIVADVMGKTDHMETPMTVAVMGCAVNGPGEAREADLGIACGTGSGLLFRRGEIIRKVPESQIVDILVAEILHYNNIDEYVSVSPKHRESKEL